MDIVVCFKQVPDVKDVRIDPDTGNLIREGVPSIINPDDKHAIEAALMLHEKHGGKITIITMGPLQAEEAIREAFAMGIHEGILLKDKAFAGADTSATSYTLWRTLEAIGNFDIILCGKQTMDSSTAQVGPQLAELLHIPQITYARKIEIDGKKVRVERLTDDGYELVEIKLPVLITVSKEMNEPRTASMNAVMDAYEKEIVVWGAGDLDVDRDMTGIQGSPTRIKKAFTPELKAKGEILSGSAREKVSALVSKLLERNVI